GVLKSLAVVIGQAADVDTPKRRDPGALNRARGRVHGSRLVRTGREPTNVAFDAQSPSQVRPLPPALEGTGASEQIYWPGASKRSAQTPLAQTMASGLPSSSAHSPPGGSCTMHVPTTQARPAAQRSAAAVNKSSSQSSPSSAPEVHVPTPVSSSSTLVT